MKLAAALVWLVVIVIAVDLGGGDIQPPADPPRAEKEALEL